MRNFLKDLFLLFQKILVSKQATWAHVTFVMLVYGINLNSSECKLE